MESLKEVWNSVLCYCQDRERLSEVAYKVWISPLELVDFEDLSATLFIRTEFQKGIIEKQYLKLLKDAFADVLGFDVTINIITEDESKKLDYNPSSYLSQISEENDLRQHDGGEYEYTFDTFIVGASNKFAHAASLAVATHPVDSYNPLFIYGGSGLGKTHLLYAINNEIKKNNPSSNVIYVKGEQFTNELIEAITTKTNKEFQEKYRKADVLLVDDIQFIGGKVSTEEEFFHTFNDLFQAKKQIVLTSDRPPKEMASLAERIRTRFEWGLLADIQPPDFETRVAIIRRKADLLTFYIPDDVAEYLANRLKNNIRQLEGAVKKLNAYKKLEGVSPSIMTAQTAIRDILNDNQPVVITVERIITEIARTFNITPADIRSSKRAANISEARQISMYIVHAITDMTMTAIGAEFGNRDHSTVVYANKQVELMIKRDPRKREIVEDIIKNIRGN